MQAEVPSHRIEMDSAALSRFMPMHLLLDRDGLALGYGPTLAQVLQDAAVPGARFEDLFEVRSPGGAVTVQDVLARGGNRLRLMPRNGVKAGLRGLGLRLPVDGRILLNLSFGIDLISAVRELALTDADFAATDLAMELLYLAEANAAVTRELRGLNLRLEGARVAAEEEAMTDPLTGLRNRRAADLVLERLCAARAGFGLLHMDLDYFKAVNDTLGHAAGDAVLAHFSEVLTAHVRDSDCVGRLGGDEFGVLLSHANQEQAQRKADFLAKALEASPTKWNGNIIPVSFAYGAFELKSGDNPDVAMARADQAMYEQKRAQKNAAE